MKYLLSFTLLILSFTANAWQSPLGYVGMWYTTAQSQDVWRFQCPANSKSVVMQMNVSDLQPVDLAEVNSSISKGGTSNTSAVLRFQLPYRGTNGAWSTQTFINYPYINGSGGFMYAQIAKTEIAPGDPNTDGPFQYFLLIQCKSGLYGTGSALGIANPLFVQDQ